MISLSYTLYRTNEFTILDGKVRKALIAILILGVAAASAGIYIYMQRGAGPEAQPSAENYQAFFPPMLAYDFYPNGLTRENLLTRLPEAVQKTGLIDQDENWDGVIRITGDLSIQQGVTIIIKPGTIVFVSARSDDQHTGAPAPKDNYNPKDPVKDENYVQNRVEIFNHGSLIARGTEEQPIIITSNASNPQSDDWIGPMTHHDGCGGVPLGFL